METLKTIIKKILEKLNGESHPVNNDKLIKLIQTCNNARENKGYAPRDGKTYCNIAVNAICLEFGYGGFKGLLANQIYDKLMESEEWMMIPQEEVQDLANTGNLIIAAWRNPEGHGHVCVIVPGIAGESGKWNSKTVPRVLNIGSDVFIGRGANWAFKDKPKYFIYGKNDV